MQLPHIAHVDMPFARSGSAVTNVIRHLAREHAQRGGRTTAVVSHNRATFVEHADVLAVDHTRRAPREYFTNWQTRLDMTAGAVGLTRPFSGRLQDDAQQALAAVQPEVVLVHEGHYAACTLPRWRDVLPGSVLGLYVHNSLSRSYTRRELRRLLAPADIVVCVSEYVAEEVSRRAPGARVAVVLNGTEPAVAARPTQPPTVLFVGQVAAHKGVHLLVDAALTLIPDLPDLRVRIVGSSVHGDDQPLSDYELDLRRRAASRAGNFEFLPFVARDRLGEFYSTASVVCVPSIFPDPCPLVALEAITHGAPVVSSTRGGLPEIGRDAFRYFDVDAPASLVAALRGALGALDGGRAASTARAAEITWPQQHARLLSLIQTERDKS